MVNWMRACCVALFTPLVLQTAGVAGALPAPQVVKDTEDYLVTLSLDNVVIQSVPNMAGAPYVREGFITATSKLTMVCKTERCKQNPAKYKPRAHLEMFAQVGCPVDISGGTTDSLTPQFTSSFPLQDFLAAILPPQPTAPGANDVTDIGILPNGSIQPQVSVKPLPGYIRDVSLGEAPLPTTPDAIEEIKKLGQKIDKLSGKMPDLPPVASNKPISSDDELIVSVQNSHLEVDNTENKLGSCGGTVTVRVSAHAQVQMVDSHDELDIYGDVYIL